MESSANHQLDFFKAPPAELSWKSILQGEKEKPYFQQVIKFVESERSQGKTIYPANSDVFNALSLTPLPETKVVIIGQDPYHGPRQAHGLCFSVQKGVPFPPSLENIFKELHDDLGCPKPPHGCLEEWARQGVLLLNAVLTVEAGKPQSHRGIGWEEFTDRIISVLNKHREKLVFLLWGSSAQKKGAVIDPEKHFILKAPHPSPLSAHRGFFGCRHFSRANELLTRVNREPIRWGLST